MALQKMVAGQLVDMTEAEETAFIASSDSLTTRRLVRIEAMKTERARRKSTGGYLAAGKWFHSDAESRDQQLGLVLAGASVPGVLWRTMDGSYVTMTQTLAQQILAAAIESDVAIHAHGESLRAAIAASDNPETVDIMSGWPAGYGE